MLKIDIASDYLADALYLHKQGRYMSALTLAGAAQEIFGQHLHRLDSESSLSTVVSSIVSSAKFFGVTKQSEKEVRDQLLAAKNSAKHFGSASEIAFEFDAAYEATVWIIRAILDYRKVFPQNIEQYRYEEEDLSVFQLNQGNSAAFPKLDEQRLREFEQWLKRND